MAENSAGKQRGKPFRKGQSGNPAGKPKGARNRTTLAAEALLDGEADALTRKAIERALEGDAVALRLCLDRILPARKDRPVSFHLPKIENAQEAAQITGALLAAVANGDITPNEAAEVGRLVDTHLRALEASEVETRLQPKLGERPGETPGERPMGNRLDEAIRLFQQRGLRRD